MVHGPQSLSPGSSARCKLLEIRLRSLECGKFFPCLLPSGVLGMTGGSWFAPLPAGGHVAVPRCWRLRVKCCECPRAHVFSPGEVGTVGGFEWRRDVVLLGSHSGCWVGAQRGGGRGQGQARAAPLRVEGTAGNTVASHLLAQARNRAARGKPRARPLKRGRSPRCAPERESPDRGSGAQSLPARPRWVAPCSPRKANAPPPKSVS